MAFRLFCIVIYTFLFTAPSVVVAAAVFLLFFSAIFSFLSCNFLALPNHSLTHALSMQSHLNRENCASLQQKRLQRYKPKRNRKIIEIALEHTSHFSSSSFPNRLRQWMCKKKPRLIMHSIHTHAHYTTPNAETNLRGIRIVFTALRILCVKLYCFCFALLGFWVLLLLLFVFILHPLVFALRRTTTVVVVVVVVVVVFGFLFFPSDVQLFLCTDCTHRTMFTKLKQQNNRKETAIYGYANAE